jgi:adenylate cyclase, class 2
MEVEIKANCFESTFSKIRSKLLKMKAKKKNETKQIDQYYNLPHQDLKGTNKYIRLRKEGKKAVFEYHINLGRGLTKEKKSSIGDVKSFETMLLEFGFRKLGKIEKIREVYTLNDFSIFLDKVIGVGVFISINIESDKKNWLEKKQECINLLQKLGLTKDNITNERLCEIATKKEL